MITWEKPSGTKITCNDTPENAALAKSLGWVKAKPKDKPKAKKKFS